MKNKELLIEAGLTPFARKCVYEKIDEIVNAKSEIDNYFVETIIVFENEITFIYDNDNDPEFDENEMLDYVEILEVKIHGYLDLIKHYLKIIILILKNQVDQKVFILNTKEKITGYRLIKGQPMKLTVFGMNMKMIIIWLLKMKKKCT